MTIVPVHPYIQITGFLMPHGQIGDFGMGMISSSPGPPPLRHSSLWLRAKSRKSTATMPSTHSRDTCVRSLKEIWLAGVTKKLLIWMEGQAQQTKTWQKKINKNIKETHPHWIKSNSFSISVCMSYCIPLYLRRPPTFDIHYASSKHPYKSLAGIDLGFSLALVSYRLTNHVVCPLFHRVRDRCQSSDSLDHATTKYLSEWHLPGDANCQSSNFNQSLFMYNAPPPCTMYHHPHLHHQHNESSQNHHKSSSPTSSHHHDHEWSSCIIRHYTSLSIIMHLTNDVSPRFSGIPILDARCTLDASTPPVVVRIWRAIRSSVCWCWALNEGPLDN